MSSLDLAEVGLLRSLLVIRIRERFKARHLTYVPFRATRAEIREAVRTYRKVICS